MISRFTWRMAVLGAAALVALGAGALYAGHVYRRDLEVRAAAVALTGGNPDLAPRLMVHYGCAGCHTIPGVRGADGLVGPPLRDLGRRVYVAGVLTNKPDHLIQWIANPRAVDPKTAMPVTGISPEEARHVAAYLYALN